MPTTTIPIGPPFAMAQNIIYALPAVKCTLFTTGTPTIQQSDAVGFSANKVITLDANNQAIVAGGWIRCTTGAITVLLKRD